MRDSYTFQVKLFFYNSLQTFGVPRSVIGGRVKEEKMVKTALWKYWNGEKTLLLYMCCDTAQTTKKELGAG